MVPVRGGTESFNAYAADNGLHLTAHAGENAGPESIWGALNLRAVLGAYRRHFDAVFPAIDVFFEALNGHGECAF